MKIYVSHSSKLNYQALLYDPLEHLQRFNNYEFILPHKNNPNELFNTKEFFNSGTCDLVLAEVSLPSTGQGLELGWADNAKIPIVYIYKQGNRVADCLKLLSDIFIEYEDANDMISKVTKHLTNRK